MLIETLSRGLDGFRLGSTHISDHGEASLNGVSFKKKLIFLSCIATSQETRAVRTKAREYAGVVSLLVGMKDAARGWGWGVCDGCWKLLTAMDLRPKKQSPDSMGMTILEHQDTLAPALARIHGSSRCAHSWL